MRSLVAGATYPFRALWLFKQQPTLLSYLVVPLLLNMGIGVGLYASIFRPGWRWLTGELNEVSAWIAQGVARLPPWLALLGYAGEAISWIVRVGFGLALFLLLGFLLAQFGSLLGAPWYGKLSEKIEKRQTQGLINIEVGLLKDVGRAIQFELNKLGLTLVVGLGCLLLNLLPGFGTLLATLGGVSLGATLVCLDFLDAPLERRRLPFKQKLSLVYQNIPGTAGFGLTCLVLVSIPLLNLLTVPLCVASGTLFFCDRLWPKYFADSGNGAEPTPPLQISPKNKNVRP